ncbi:MAG: hypothetical protein ACRBDI_10275 [Alphaproteobacteria bacterium]
MGDDNKNVTDIFKNENPRISTEGLEVSETEISADEFAQLFPDAGKDNSTKELNTPETINPDDPWKFVPG